MKAILVVVAFVVFLFAGPAGWLMPLAVVFLLGSDNK
jgi:hypothetical protein